MSALPAFLREQPFLKSFIKWAQPKEADKMSPHNEERYVAVYEEDALPINPLRRAHSEEDIRAQYVLAVPSMDERVRKREKEKEKAVVEKVGEDDDKAPMDFRRNSKGESQAVLLDPKGDEARDLIVHGANGPTVFSMYLAKPWFYSQLSCFKSNIMMTAVNLKDGAFLIRREERGLFLTYCHNKTIYHKKIYYAIFGEPREKSKTNCLRFFIGSERDFPSIGQMIAYYRRNKSNCLACKLDCGVVRARLENSMGAEEAAMAADHPLTARRSLSRPPHWRLKPAREVEGVEMESTVDGEMIDTSPTPAVTLQSPASDSSEEGGTPPTCWKFPNFCFLLSRLSHTMREEELIPLTTYEYGSFLDENPYTEYRGSKVKVPRKLSGGKTKMDEEGEPGPSSSQHIADLPGPSHSQQPAAPSSPPASLPLPQSSNSPSPQHGMRRKAPAGPPQKSTLLAEMDRNKKTKKGDSSSPESSP